MSSHGTGPDYVGDTENRALSCWIDRQRQSCDIEFRVVDIESTECGRLYA